MSNLATLKPFEKGDPRINRTGQNKGSKWLSTKLEEALTKIGEGQSESYDVLLIKRVLKSAIVDGDMRAIAHIWDRLEGKPIQQTDLTTNGKDIPTPILHVSTDNKPQEDTEA